MNETRTTTNDLFSLADRLRALREKETAINAEAKAAKYKADAAEDALATAMADAGCRNFTRDDKMFVITASEHWSPAAGCTETLTKALKEKGHKELFKVSATDLKKFINAEIKATVDENGDTHVPGWLAGLVRCHNDIGVSMRKATNKAK